MHLVHTTYRADGFPRSNDIHFCSTNLYSIFSSFGFGGGGGELSCVSSSSSSNSGLLNRSSSLGLGSSASPFQECSRSCSTKSKLLSSTYTSPVAQHWTPRGQRHAVHQEVFDERVWEGDHNRFDRGLALHGVAEGGVPPIEPTRQHVGAGGRRRPIVHGAGWT